MTSLTFQRSWALNPEMFSSSNIPQISWIVLNDLFFLKYEIKSVLLHQLRNVLYFLCFSNNISIVFWDDLCNVRENINVNLFEIGFYNSRFIWANKYFLKYCNRSIVPANIIYHIANYFEVSSIIHSGIQSGSATCHYRTSGNGASGCLLLKDLYPSYCLYILSISHH